MPRTKSFSSSLATIRDLSLNIADTVQLVQDDFDKLSADSKRLKEIEPALAKLQSALNPPAVPAAPSELAPAGEPVETKQTASGQTETPKRHRAKKDKGPSNGTDTGTE